MRQTTNGSTGHIAVMHVRLGAGGDTVSLNCSFRMTLEASRVVSSFQNRPSMCQSDAHLQHARCWTDTLHQRSFPHPSVRLSKDRIRVLSVRCGVEHSLSPELDETGCETERGNRIMELLGGLAAILGPLFFRVPALTAVRSIEAPPCGST